MKIAIPLFGERVSPHFATAPELLLVQIAAGRIIVTWKLNLAPLSSKERLEKFLVWGIKTLICGGINEGSRSWFEKHGVCVEADRMGDAKDMLEGYLREMESKNNKEE